jgi:hypothetical protein
MAAKTFIDILEDQIRQDLRAEIRKEIEQELKEAGMLREDFEAGSAASTTSASSMSARVETWLTANIGKTVFGRSQQARQAYRSAHPHRGAQPQPPPPPKPSQEPAFTPQGVEDLMAAEIIRRQSGVKLAATFTENELKSAWRRAALKTHPDLYSQADAVTQAKAHAHFQELVAAYERLQAALLKQAA